MDFLEEEGRGMAQSLRGSSRLPPCLLCDPGLPQPTLGSALTLSPICTTFWLGASGANADSLCCGRVAARQFPGCSWCVSCEFLRKAPTPMRIMGALHPLSL